MKRHFPLLAALFLACLGLGILLAAIFIPPAAPIFFDSISRPTASTTPAATSATTTTAIPPKSKEKRLTAYTTSYTWWDNTPPGSSIIAFRKSDGYPTLHDIAGGSGTYTDPVTIAVGHVNANGIDTPDFKPGTRFYIPNVRAYFMVEDTCGDGDAPQNIPCHDLATADAGAQVWLDMWVDGQSLSARDADACAGDLTANHLVIENPDPNYEVVEGPIIELGRCRQGFGETLVLRK